MSVVLKKLKVISGCFLLTFSTFSASVAHADSETALGDRIDLSLKDNGELTVKNTYLTYYMLRGVDDKGNVKGMRLIERSPERVDFDVLKITKWNGLLPAVEITPPKFASAETVIDLSKEGYNWKNSSLRVVGASISDIVLRPVTSRESEASDRLVVFLMNTLALAEITTDVVSKVSGLENNSFSQLKSKLQPLADKIVKIKKTLDNAQILLDFSDVMVTQTELLISESGIDINDYPNLAETLAFYKDVSETVRKMMKSAGVVENANSYRVTIRKAFKKSLTQAWDEGSKELLSSASDFNKKYAELLRNEVNQVSDKNKKLAKFNRLFLEPVAATLELVVNAKKQELKNARSTSAKNKIKAEISVLRNGYAFIKLASFIELFQSDFVEVAKKHPEKVIPMLFDIAKAVVIAIHEADGGNHEVNIAKGILQQVTHIDGRSTVFRSINKSNKFMSAFQVGGIAGNVVIPFIWDLVLGEGFLTTDIVEGNLSRLGTPETEVKVNLANNEVRYFHNVDAKQSSGEKPIYLAVGVGKKVVFTPSMKWQQAFSKERAPWSGKWLLPAHDLYEYAFKRTQGGKDLYDILRFCVGDDQYALDTANFSVIRIYNQQNELGGLQCHDKEAFKILNPDVLAYYKNESDIDPRYRLQSLASENAEPIMAGGFTLESKKEQTISVGIKGKDYDAGQEPTFHYIFRVVPKNIALSTTIAIDSSDTTRHTISAKINLTQAEKNKTDSIDKLVWEWGDGQKTTIDIASNALFEPYAHRYAHSGSYTVKATLYRKSGQLATDEQTIAVGKLIVPPPTNFTAELEGIDGGKLSWTTLSSKEITGYELTIKQAGSTEYPKVILINDPVIHTYYAYTLGVGSFQFELRALKNKEKSVPVHADLVIGPQLVSQPKLNDTGITQCATAAASKKFNCSKAVANATGNQIPLGQDGHYGTGKNGSKGMSFTKVSGYEGKCVQDNHTGLMWEVKQDSGLHSKEHTYTWYSTTNNNGDMGKQNGGKCSGSNCDTAAFVEAVNSAGWCGHNDWRLPTVRELHSIVDYSRRGPAIETAYFPNTKYTTSGMYGTNDIYRSYWSSSPSAYNTNSAWVVSFSEGYDNSDGGNYKGHADYVRLVRVGQ